MRAQLRRTGTVAFLLVVVITSAPLPATATPLGTAWSTAQKIDEVAGNHADVNTPFLDGCPIQSPDDTALYLASNRPGGLGGLDIWVSRRSSPDAPWGAPENLGAPVNSAADDFCPTPTRGKGLLFVSRRQVPGACGMGDIYVTRLDKRHGWRAPQHLDCAPVGPNTALDEQGPSLVDLGDRSLLFYSSGPDIFISTRPEGGSFGAGSAVAELNTSGPDIQPNVRKDGREIVFASSEPSRPGALGGFDLYRATRASTEDSWSAPVNLGPAVNTGLNETRPSLSWHARQLLFGRAPGPEGQSDIYVSTRA